jgi:phage terminase large subunit-like protein
MYHRLRLLLKDGFAISKEYVELRRQLAPVPLWYDREGRIYLPPKNAQPGDDEDMVTMTKLIGCSPDQSDALVLAVHGMTSKVHRQRVSSMV